MQQYKNKTNNKIKEKKKRKCCFSKSIEYSTIIDILQKRSVENVQLIK